MHKNSLVYQQLGGEDAISGVVDLFYAKAINDSRIGHFFDQMDMVKMRAHQRDFLIYALGGSNHYMGKSLKKAHAHLKLTNEHFDIIAEHLAKTLEALHVAPDLIGEVMMIVSSYRSEIVSP